MSSLHLSLSPPLFSPSSSSSSSTLLFTPGILSWGNGQKRINLPKCSAVSNSRTQDYADVFQPNGLPLIKWHEIVEDDIEEEALKVSISNEIHKRVNVIKSMLGSMEDGEISVSAYDTAWVALVEDVNGSGKPQFPESLEWIAKNQLSDGSWGDEEIFLAHDRLLNTIGCVVALRYWNMHPDKCEKGLSFFRDNLDRLKDESIEHMPIGFEVAFPSILELAQKLNIDVPHDSPVLKEIHAARDLKLRKIPKDIMHKVPTTLLHSLEGMPGLDWEKLLKLQSKDGSFLFSPSSTAYALMQTKDQNCLSYLNKAVQKFDGGVPNVYPVDLFENIWAVDRLQRLGISRYFETEIKECVNYIHRYWEKEGICWARNSEVQDIDDTAMGFRILRLHGHEVSPDVFNCFKKDDGFICFAGQSNQAVTGMFNLYRASQVMFPGETILDQARDFSSKFLRHKQEANEVLDKWIITKDLPGEVKYALDLPWYASLPRVEARFYLEQYGGENDVWIGKTLYRMPFVNNNDYLHLAKIDFNNCQAFHRMEWDNFQKWYEECNLGNYGISKRNLLYAYFVAAATIFEPERSKERISWAKTTILVDTIESYFSCDGNNCSNQRRAFVQEFKTGITAREAVNGRKMNTKKTRQELLETLFGTLNHFSVDAMMSHGREIGYSLRQAWEKWLLNWEKEGEREGEAELLVQTINQTGGRWSSQQVLEQNPQYQTLSQLTNRICQQLHHHKKKNMVSQDNGCSSSSNKSHKSTSPQIESDMQQLVELVLKNSSESIDSDAKQAFLAVAKSFYYGALCEPGTVNQHIARVLFERVF